MNVSSYTLTDRGEYRILNLSPMIHLKHFRLSKSGNSLWAQDLVKDENGFVDKGESMFIPKGHPFFEEWLRDYAPKEEEAEEEA